MQGIATPRIFGATTLPESKSPIAAARSPVEGFWRSRARSTGAWTPAFACPKPPATFYGRSRP